MIMLLPGAVSVAHVLICEGRWRSRQQKALARSPTVCRVPVQVPPLHLLFPSSN